MTDQHPTAAELLELHFGEAGAVRAARLTAHTRQCSSCRALLADVDWAERLLAAEPAPEPPVDGLERVLSRVAATDAPAAPPARAWRAALPSAAAVAAGTLAAVFGGAIAAVLFFAAGSLVTLSLAPALILENQRRGGAPATR